MNKTLSVGAKLTILVILAALFGATMVALSVKTKTSFEHEGIILGNDKSFEKSFAVQPNGKLIINADVGNISITGSDVQEVKVRAIARGSDRQLQRLDVKFDLEGNTVKVEERFSHRYINFFGNNSIDVQFDIQVPREFNFDLRTAGGNIDIQNVKGRIDGETSGGNLDLARLEGNVKLTTSGGNVEVRNSSCDLVLKTSGGNMYGESISGPIHMETSGGNITLKEIDGKLYASTSGGNIHASAKDNKGIELSTSGGNIIVEIPKSITADVKAEASGGDVSCELEFSGKIKDGRMNGKINGGGQLIRLETSGGDIIINSFE